MSRNLKEKIALGTPLTDVESEELLNDPTAKALSEGMHKVEQLVESIRCEKPPTETLTRVRLSAQRPGFHRKPKTNLAASLAYSSAALIILGVPLAVIIGAQLNKSFSAADIGDIDRALKAGGIGILVYGRNTKSGELEPLYATYGTLLPESRAKKESRTKPLPRLGPVYVPVRFWEESSELGEARQIYLSIRREAVLTYDDPLKLARLWIGQTPGAPKPTGSVVLEINRRATNLKEWRIEAHKSPRWVMAYGSKVTGFMPRLDFWEMRQGKASLALRQDCFPYEGDFLGNKARFAPAGQVERRGSQAGSPKPPN